MSMLKKNDLEPWVKYSQAASTHSNATLVSTHEYYKYLQVPIFLVQKNETDT